MDYAKKLKLQKKNQNKYGLFSFSQDSLLHLLIISITNHMLHISFPFPRLMLKRKEKKMGVTAVTAIGQKANNDFTSEINKVLVVLLRYTECKIDRTRKPTSGIEVED